jgi:hypothetical protein
MLLFNEICIIEAYFLDANQKQRAIYSSRVISLLVAEGQGILARPSNTGVNFEFYPIRYHVLGFAFLPRLQALGRGKSYQKRPRE